jgi:hypothetical protein
MKTFAYAAIAVFCMLAMSPVAKAGALNGWLADCTAVTTTSCTEVTTSGYARQAITFNYVANGVIAQANSFTFAQAGTAGASLAGRAVYDASTGGNLQLVIPLAATATVPSYGDRGDVGSLKFTLAGSPNLTSLDGYVASYAAGATLGATPDGSSVTAGIALQAAYGRIFTYPGDYDPLYSVGNTETTGFSVTIPNGTSTFGISGAGTLSTGTIVLQASPFDGELQRLYCDVTVTALTITAPSGYSFIGTAPTTCGASAPHLLQYFVGAKKVRVLF